MPGIKGIIEICVQNKDGTVTRHESIPMNSFVQNLAYLLATLLRGAWTSIKSTANATISGSYMLNTSPGVSLAGDDTYGVLVGTDNTAWDKADYNLIAKILHGSTTGKFQYGLEVASSVSWSVTKWIFSKYRVFSNVSGASITVKEIGLAMKDDYANLVLLSREIPAPIVVADSGSLKVTYSFELTA